MQIVVRQVSGLGNQLFQYAAGRYYAKQYGAAMRMALDRPRHANSYGSPRPFLLSQFMIDTPTQPLTVWDRFLIGPRRPFRAFSFTVKRALDISVFQESEEQRYRFIKNLDIPDRVRTLYLVGYWQTYRMVEQIEDELRTSLRFRHSPTGKNAETLSRIRACENPVSIHIRRGDYTLAAEGNIALSLDYYLRALVHMRQEVSNPVFFVFSDDIEFARKNLPSDLNAVFVDHNDDMSSHEDLRLMSSCHHHIIANSTFSWWGSWLNPRLDKMIVAPKHWLLADESYYPDLLPANWTLIAT